MTDERCERTDLIRTQCAHCLGHRDPIADAIATEAPRAYAVDIDNPRTAIARYPGRCPSCREPIQPGDLIVATAAPEHGAEIWACAGCGP